MAQELEHGRQAINIVGERKDGGKVLSTELVHHNSPK